MGSSKLFAVACVTVAGLAVAACGGDNSSTSASTQPSASTGATTTAQPAQTSVATAGATISFSTTNTKKQSVDRTGETIKIGFSNLEGTAFALPEFRVPAEVAVKYINANGGVNGAKIDLQTCLVDGTPEASVKCANQFVDAGVDVATYGIDVAAEAALPIYGGAGIPFVVPTTYSEAQKTDPNSFAFQAAIEAYAATTVAMMKEKGVKHLGLVMEDTGKANHDFEQLLKGYAEAAGLQFTSGFVEASGSNYVPVIQSVISAGSDGLFAFLSEPGCGEYVKYVKQAAFAGPVIAGSCVKFVSDNPDAAEGVYTILDRYFPGIADLAPPNIQSNLALYTKAMTDAGQDKYIPNALAVQPFSLMMDLKSVLETIPAGTEINAASIKAALKGATVPGFAGPDITCTGQVWPGNTSTCRGEVLPLQATKSGATLVLKPVSTESNGFRNDATVVS